MKLFSTSLHLSVVLLFLFNQLKFKQMKMYMLFFFLIFISCGSKSEKQPLTEITSTDSIAIEATVSSTAEKPTEPKTIDIKKTSSVINSKTGYKEIIGMKKITQEERIELKIDQLKAHDIYKLENKEIVKGPIYFEDGKRKILSIVNAVYEHGVFEYLISYDNEGKIVDCLDIASDRYYAFDFSEGVLMGSTVKVILPEWQDEDGEVYKESSTTYKITPEMKFIKSK